MTLEKTNLYDYILTFIIKELANSYKLGVMTIPDSIEGTFFIFDEYNGKIYAKIYIAFTEAYGASISVDDLRKLPRSEHVWSFISWKDFICKGICKEMSTFLRKSIYQNQLQELHVSFEDDLEITDAGL